MSAEEFMQAYCIWCGSQRCEGIGTDWFDGCSYKSELTAGDYCDEPDSLEVKEPNG